VRRGEDTSSNSIFAPWVVLVLKMPCGINTRLPVRRVGQDSPSTLRMRLMGIWVGRGTA